MNPQLAGYFPGGRCPNDADTYHVVPVYISSSHPLRITEIAYDADTQTRPCPHH